MRLFGENVTKRPNSFKLFFGLMAIALAPASGSAFGQDAPAAPAAPQTEPQASSDKELGPDPEFDVPVDERTAGEIDSLIRSLGAPASTERDAAVTRLVEIGVPTFARLRGAYHQTDDLEVKLRIESVVLNAFFDYHVYDAHAFLGVSLRPFVPTNDNRLPIPDGVTGLLIAQVIKDTSAERFGLQQNDVIVGCDGESLTGRGQEAQERFSRGIASRKPGSPMHLTIVRAESTFDVTITLGRAPRDVAVRGRAQAINEAMEKAEERFYPWWRKHFGEQDSNTSDRLAP